MSVATGEIHPALAEAAAAKARTPSREGDTAAVEQDWRYTATEGGVTLSVSLTRGRSGWLVAEARYRIGNGATPQLKGVLETFCHAIEGLPVQEAADHGTIHACEQLREQVREPLVQGIHTPRSMGSAFGLCDRLIRDVLGQYRVSTGEKETRNFWNPVLSQQWRLKTNEQQLEALRPALETFRKSNALADNALWIARIEKMRRVIIDFHESVEAARKPLLLMHLEVAMRKATGERLETYMEELKDDNVIRRLGSEPTRAVS
jgi:hypothetical protein